MANKYAIRRALIRAAVRYSLPQELNTLLCDDGVILLEADPAALVAEWDELTDFGCLLPVPGYPNFRSVSPTLRQKVEAGETLLNLPFFSGNPRG